jgi:hypothetical protein
MNSRTIDADNEADRQLVADLLEKCLVREFEQGNNWWRLSDSARFWFKERALAHADGVEALERISFSVLPLPEGSFGVAIDAGFLYRSSEDVAHFFDETVDSTERDRRKRRFNRLRGRGQGRKGTLLYDTDGKQVTTCYFDRFAHDVTCGSVPGFGGANSLFDYCRRKYPNLSLSREDPVAYVSFKGLRRSVPVPARWLRLRVSLDRDQMPRQMRQAVSMSPEQRRTAAIKEWEPVGPRAMQSVGFRDAGRLWCPGTAHEEQLQCPRLLFARGRTVEPPACVSVEGYRRYFKERSEKLAGGGAFRFEPHVERSVYVVTPNWDDALDRQYAKDLQASLCGITGLPFQLQSVRADTPEETVERLLRFRPGTAVIVFDPRTTDQAAYGLLSYELKEWCIKRLLRQKLEERWDRLISATKKADRDHAERQWKNAIDLSALDVLDQMGTTLWRIDSFGYDACLAIDVGRERRHFAISLLVCRDLTAATPLVRITRWWHKADHQHESINPAILAKSVEDLAADLQGRAVKPLNSILVLRDGHQCGNELEGITRGFDVWKRRGILQQSALADVVDVQKHSVRGVRMWRKTQQAAASNVFEGRAIYLSDHVAYLCATGCAGLSAHMTADPTVLIGSPQCDIKRISRAFFALAQLNYSTPSTAHRLAQPLREVDAVLEDCQMRNMRGIR